MRLSKCKFSARFRSFGTLSHNSNDATSMEYLERVSTTHLLLNGTWSLRKVKASRFKRPKHTLNTDNNVKQRGNYLLYPPDTGKSKLFFGSFALWRRNWKFYPFVEWNYGLFAIHTHALAVLVVCCARAYSNENLIIILSSLCSRY